MSQAIKTAQNPNMALTALCRNNPALASVLELCKNKDPQAVFYEECKKRGVDPEEIINLMR